MSPGSSRRLSNDKSVLRWGDVKGPAEQAFNIWTHERELKWAKFAWELLAEQGLADYSNELERHEAMINFMALGGFYREFCALAWQERDGPMYSFWAEEWELDDFVIGQLVGRDPAVNRRG